MSAPAADPIDTASAGYLSFHSPLHGTAAFEGVGVSTESAPSGAAALQAELAVQEYPLRRSKVERPILPLETLRRDRLLEWLDASVRRRLTFVVAEAGFGKTTLLADFARRTRLRTIWYRIDEDDIDPMSFLRYFIAACQTADRSLMHRSEGLLADAATRPVTWEAILESVCVELVPLAAEPTVLFFDDYHLAEQYGHVRQIVERLIARAPEPISFVVASRRSPNLAVARLRACEGLAELGREELRFDRDETDRLFREVYSQPLESDVLADLQSRTEGWVASLQLVKAAVRGRSAADVRTFIGTLSAGEGELYDYLAEEVIADLPEETQRFLSRVSILDEIDPAIAAPAADMELADARVQLTAAQRLGLVTRTARMLGPARLHPLVREFLEARLTSEIGWGGVRQLHRRVAVLYEPTSWRSAARHWGAAGDGDDVCRVVKSATGTILGTGEFEAADDFITRFARPDPNPWFDILRSRVAYSHRELGDAVRLGLRARDLAADMHSEKELLQLAALHSLYMTFEAHDAPATAAMAAVMSQEELDDEGAAIAAAAAAIAADEDLRLTTPRVERVRAIARALGRGRYEGIAEVNLATNARVVGDLESALVHCDAAVRLLSAHGTPDELGAARMTRAQILAHLGRMDEARKSADDAMVDWPAVMMIAEAADMLGMYDDLDAATEILQASAAEARADSGERSVLALARARILAATGQLDEAQRTLDAIQVRPVYCGFRSQLATLHAQLAVQTGSAVGVERAAQAVSVCERQGAGYWGHVARLIASAVAGPVQFNSVVARCTEADGAYISIVAELIVPRLGVLAPDAQSVVLGEVGRRPVRWRAALRRYLAGTHAAESMVEAAKALELVGTQSDITAIRAVAKATPRSARRTRLGCQLIHRLAPRFLIEDLGPVAISSKSITEPRIILGNKVRRKVLALLCYLLTRPKFAATVDQIVDALWSGLDPETSTNSLNQTIYFLRRIFEPEYDDVTTAGYVRHERDLVWLDADLVSSRSQECLSLMSDAVAIGSGHAVDVLAATYVGPFALDFAYDDWSAAFRESLHARYLAVLEKAIRRDTAAGAFDHAISLAQRAVEVDPQATEIEVCLLRLYRETGAHSAAAEQYLHYAAAYRDETGAEPPALDSL